MGQGLFLLSFPRSPPYRAAVPRAPTSPIAEAVRHGHSLRMPIARAPAWPKTVQSPSTGTPDKDLIPSPLLAPWGPPWQAWAVTHPRAPSKVLWISFRTPAGHVGWGGGQRPGEASRGQGQTQASPPPRETALVSTPVFQEPPPPPPPHQRASCQPTSSCPDSLSSLSSACSMTGPDLLSGRQRPGQASLGPSSAPAPCLRGGGGWSLEPRTGREAVSTSGPNTTCSPGVPPSTPRSGPRCALSPNALGPRGLAYRLRHSGSLSSCGGRKGKAPRSG